MSENLEAQGIELGTSGPVTRNFDDYSLLAKKISLS
jgi:hypothetical protein